MPREPREQATRAKVVGGEQVAEGRHQRGRERRTGGEGGRQDLCEPGAPDSPLKEGGDAPFRGKLPPPRFAVVARGFLFENVLGGDLCATQRRVETLAGEENLYRIRVGDYRIVYQIRDKVLVVVLVRIRHRRDVYRNL